ncbi:formate/nitrite transporter family protein [Natrinema thermotolerans]|uniref:Formate/nitrite transporter family protein n=1 Tax=Natrinema thermotolerans TaxID=121872 RepID=A0AAF0PDH8_9EURY|nr:formate/nitrite transporter family protein [Natrinema thermotolerans]QCC57430.1 formate/nitrite transporter family protein [Natrinema thermotolerans]WMT08504.1 formate/nitrite transporter family protein [Natrinema thermotolerans]
MSVAPDPAEIFDRAVDEGQRRLEQSLLELAATSFIAGFTIVFGIVALGVVDGLVEPQFGEAAHVAGALTFGVGMVFLVVGRTELFNENFFDPVAAAAARDGTWLLVPIGRLWAVTLVFNLVGGFLFAVVFAVDGVLPPESAHALSGTAEGIVNRPARGIFASAIVGGALVSLLSFLLAAADSVGSRLALAYLVGFLLALGPFDHVVVTAIHVFFGYLFDAAIGSGALGETIAVSAAGNVVGGIGLVTFAHVAQVRGADGRDD